MTKPFVSQLQCCDWPDGNFSPRTYSTCVEKCFVSTYTRVMLTVARLNLVDSLSGTTTTTSTTSTASSSAATWAPPTLASGISNYTNGYEPAGYYLDSTGLVHVRGMVSGATAGATLFTLPSTCCPAYPVKRLCIASGTSNDQLVEVVVSSGGVVSVQTSAANTTSAFSNSWLNLGMLLFSTAA